MFNYSEFAFLFHSLFSSHPYFSFNLIAIFLSTIAAHYTHVPPDPIPMGPFICFSFLFFQGASRKPKPPAGTARPHRWARGPSSFSPILPGLAFQAATPSRDPENCLWDRGAPVTSVQQQAALQEGLTPHIPCHLGTGEGGAHFIIIFSSCIPGCALLPDGGGFGFLTPSRSLWDRLSPRKAAKRRLHQPPRCDKFQTEIPCSEEF